MRRSPALPGAVATLLAVGLMLAGCGSEDGSTGRAAEGPGSPSEQVESSAGSSSPTATPGAEVVPSCADLWVAGATLPRRYQGCLEGGEQVAPESRACSIGTRLFTHADRFYAVPGGPVQEATPALLEDPDYRQVLAVCTG